MDIKMNKRTLIPAGIAGVIFMLLLQPAAVMGQGGLSAGLKLGTTGFGVEGVFGLTERLNVRAGLSSYDFTVTYETSDNDPDVELELDSDNRAVSLLLDYLPFKRGFRVTGGFIHQGPRFRGSGIPIESYTDPDTGLVIPASEMGSIQIDLEYEKKLSPYLGIGFGNSVGNQRLTFSFDAGVIFTGKPSLTSRTFGRMSDVVDYDEQELREGVEKVTVLPMISFGLSYRIL